MNTILTNSIHKLKNHELLSHEEFVSLLKGNSRELRQELATAADAIRRKHFKNHIYIRGLIEFSNYCKNNCYYCGIRHGNHQLERYRLSKEEILSCCKDGYQLGFRTFVLQSGEDPYYTDSRMIDIISAIHTSFPDCAITLSIGERESESYQNFFNAGAERYLLRHETANECHYKKLHPPSMSYQHRINCLTQLKNIGYQVGCGFMVGSPYQTPELLANDLLFIQDFHPHMIGIGPFLSHKDTPFFDKKNGTLEETLLLISIIRLIHPTVLLPATTALGTITGNGRELGILAGANVVMPNLSPTEVRKQYQLYDHKICTGEESAQCIRCLSNRMENIHFKITVDRGDSPDIL